MEKDLQDGMRDTIENTFMPLTSLRSGIGQTLTHDIYCYTNQIVNLCFIGGPEKPNDWVLIDTGVPKSAEHILDAAKERFGDNNKPKAIILTHGHFDHVGAAVDLVQKWNVPVYAHEAELPYLTGKLSYPEPDGSVEGGLLAKISPFFPNESVDLGQHVKAIPSDGSIPNMPEWRWIHTPGHSPGHISLFREQDHSLIAGDAFVTVRQDSLYNVLTQKLEINGPPRYLTTDWVAAKESVKKLEALRPAMAITGHGQPVSGDVLSKGLKKLVQEFDQIAIPDYGRYIN